MKRCRWLCSIAVAMFVVVVARALGQGGPQEGRKGPPPGKGPPGFLRQLDINRDGMLDTEELTERARPVLDQAVRAMGGDLRRGIAVEGVEDAVAAAVSSRSRPRRGN